jgi:hypothetical protein
MLFLRWEAANLRLYLGPIGRAVEVAVEKVL